jgi:hypothetical protein
MLGNAERVDPACRDLDDERDIQPLQCHGVDVEEVDRRSSPIGDDPEASAVAIVRRSACGAGATMFPV